MTSATTTTPSSQSSSTELSVLDFNWGQKGHLTRSQQDALMQVKQAATQEKLLDPTASEETNEQRLLRFLRDRRFNVKATLSRLRKDTQWRATFPTPDVRDFPELLQWHKDGAFYLAGQDKYGRPLVVLKLAKLYPKKIDSVDSIIGFLKAYSDLILEHAQKNGWSELSAIGDMEGWSIRDNFALSLVASLNEFSTLHYPETQGLTFLVNLPWTFNMAISMVRPFTDERQMSRIINVWDKNELYKIHEHVDLNVLEQRYGGTRPDGSYPIPDPIMSELLSKGKAGTGDGVAAAAAAAAKATQQEQDAESTFFWFRALTPALRSMALCLVMFVLSIMVLSRDTVLSSVVGASLLGVSGAFLWTSWYGLREASLIASVVKGSNNVMAGKKKAQTRIGIPLTCQMAESRIGGGGKYVEYRIDLYPKNGDPWTIWRRYSQFYKLATNTALGRRCKAPLPAKTFLSHMESEFVNERREGLKVWLDAFLVAYGGMAKAEEGVIQFLQLGG